uniref:Prefoldin subunit 1 n=1 Tax=Calidris pygmaea TaxID=425635 RepID=A0A8C3KAD4_9CHAR
MSSPLCRPHSSARRLQPAAGPAAPPAPPRRACAEGHGASHIAQAPCGDKMAAPVDLELKKAFTELQAKVIDTQQKVKLADIQIEQLSKTKKHAHLTDTEVMMLVDETRMYEGVGRMFILQSKGVIHNQLLEKQRIAEEKIKELEQKKSYLERSVKEAEDNIREMLMARRAQ